MMIYARSHSIAPRLLGCLIVIVLAISAPMGDRFANAATVTFAYETTINSTSGSSAFGDFLGQTMFLQYTFNDETMGNTDTNSDPDVGFYSFTNLLLTVGTNSWTSTEGQIQVHNAVLNNVYTLESSSISGPAIDGLSPGGMVLSFNGPGTIFTSDALPLVQPDPSDFSTHTGISIGFGTSRPNLGSLSGSPVTIATPIPIPSSFLLFGSGLVALIGWNSRKWKRV